MMALRCSMGCNGILLSATFVISFFSHADVVVNGINMSKKSGGSFLTPFQEPPSILDMDINKQSPSPLLKEKKEEEESPKWHNAIDKAVNNVKEKLSILNARAEAGDSDAAYQLAVVFHKGTSVPVDYSRAIYFYKLASAGGSYQARKMMSLILSGPKDKQGNVTTQWMQILASSIPVNNNIEKQY